MVKMIERKHCLVSFFRLVFISLNQQILGIGTCQFSIKTQKSGCYYFLCYTWSEIFYWLLSRGEILGIWIIETLKEQNEKTQAKQNNVQPGLEFVSISLYHSATLFIVWNKLCSRTLGGNFTLLIEFYLKVISKMMILFILLM